MYGYDKRVLSIVGFLYLGSAGEISDNLSIPFAGKEAYRGRVVTTIVALTNEGMTASGVTLFQLKPWVTSCFVLFLSFNFLCTSTLIISDTLRRFLNES